MMDFTPNRMTDIQRTIAEIEIRAQLAHSAAEAIQHILNEDVSAGRCEPAVMGGLLPRFDGLICDTMRIWQSSDMIRRADEYQQKRLWEYDQAAHDAVVAEIKQRDESETHGHKVVPARDIPSDIEVKDGRTTGHCPECGNGPMYTLYAVPTMISHLFRSDFACQVCIDTERGLYNPKPAYENDNETLYEAIHERIPAATYDHTGGGVYVTYAATPLGLFTLAATDESGIMVYCNQPVDDDADLDSWIEYCEGEGYNDPEQEVASFSLLPRWGYLLPSDMETLAAAAEDLYRWACEMESPDSKGATWYQRPDGVFADIVARVEGVGIPVDHVFNDTIIVARPDDWLIVAGDVNVDWGVLIFAPGKYDVYDPTEQEEIKHTDPDLATKVAESIVRLYHSVH